MTEALLLLILFVLCPEPFIYAAAILLLPVWMLISTKKETTK